MSPKPWAILFVTPARRVVRRWVNQALTRRLSSWSGAVRRLLEARDRGEAMGAGRRRSAKLEAVREWKSNARAWRVVSRAFGTVSGRGQRRAKRECFSGWVLVACGVRRRQRNAEMVSCKAESNCVRVALFSWASMAGRARRTRGNLRRCFGKQMRMSLVVGFEAFASAGRDRREQRLRDEVAVRAELQVASLVHDASESVGAAERRKRLRLEAGYASVERILHRMRSRSAAKGLASWKAHAVTQRRLRISAARCVGRMRQRTVGPALEKWAGATAHSRRLRRASMRCLQKMRARAIGPAMELWKSRAGRARLLEQRKRGVMARLASKGLSSAWGGVSPKSRHAVRTHSCARAHSFMCTCASTCREIGRDENRGR